MLNKEPKIDFAIIEKKWQDAWEKKKAFVVKEEGKSKKKFYCLEMFPYPSSSGLHMGHALNYTIGDIYARFKRMNGFNVLYPMGYDALGLPAENAAIKADKHPREFTEKAIENYIKQQKSLGLSYDWTKLIKTCDPEYYKWNQYFFLKFLEKGLVYRKKAAVNFCSKCNTVLANEQVHSGKCWRHEDTDVEVKHLEQWFIRTTKYAEELLRDSEKLQWPDRIKNMQKNWIGKSHGTEINFEINGEKWPIFTTRPDTLHGVTFMVISSQHEKLAELITDKQKPEVEKFLKKIRSVSEKEILTIEKQGAFTGTYAKNPITGEEIPVWIGNFVVADYGSGMVMAVPAHDQRDWEFAKKYGIKIKEVIKGGNIGQSAYVGEGELVNSGKFDGQNSKNAIESITDYLIKNKLGKRTTEFKLKDWLVSRQRYWGTPIPIIYCNKCGIVPVPEKQLPVELPKKVKFGKGNPLATSKSFVNVDCPKCKGKARRETDTMDTFFDSSWYFLRYCDSKNSKVAFDKKKVAYWMPVDQYIGGAEHACMHLIYARFFTKALRDMGFIKFGEPFIKLFNQGMLHGPDGEKMSKSKGNVINPDEVSKKYGMDTARLFLVSVAGPEKDIDWSEEGIQGSLRFINRVVEYFNKVKFGKSNKIVESKVNSAILEITEDIENFKYNFAVIKLRELFEVLEKESVSDQDLMSFLKLFSLFCPHITEELWSKRAGKGAGFISLEKWPVANKGKINRQLEKQEEKISNLIKDINNILRILEAKKQTSKEIKIFVIPHELKSYLDYGGKIQLNFSQKIEILSIQEAGKTGKVIKAKPGKPGILIE